MEWILILTNFINSYTQIKGSRHWIIQITSKVSIYKGMIIKVNMTQDEKWMFKYNEVMEFINTNHRNLSKYRIEEHNMLNWVKQQRKLLNAGSLKLERIERFRGLLAIIEENKRVNQYQ